MTKDKVTRMFQKYAGYLFSGLAGSLFLGGFVGLVFTKKLSHVALFGFIGFVGSYVSWHNRRTFFRIHREFQEKWERWREKFTIPSRT